MKRLDFPVATVTTKNSHLLGFSISEGKTLKNSLHRNDSGDIPYKVPRLPSRNGDDEKLASIRVFDIRGKNSLHRNDSGDVPYEAPRLPGRNGDDKKLAPIIFN